MLSYRIGLQYKSSLKTQYYLKQIKKYYIIQIIERSSLFVEQELLIGNNFNYVIHEFTCVT